MKYLTHIMLTALLFTAGFSQAAEYTVGQKNKAFTQDTISVKVGDTVHFKNEDSFFHNVFSLSDTQFFDLGSYPQGESKPVTFEAPGTVEVECAIHPEMIMKVEVTQ